VTYTATDAAGLTLSESFTVTVTDTQKPTIVAPANVVVNGWCQSVPANLVTVGSPATSDNCAGASVTNNAPAQFPVGVTAVKWIVTDASGNKDSAMQTVTVTPATVTATAAVTPLYPFPAGNANHLLRVWQHRAV
jgi:hypothetical protein